MAIAASKNIMTSSPTTANSNSIAAKAMGAGTTPLPRNTAMPSPTAATPTAVGQPTTAVKSTVTTAAPTVMCAANMYVGLKAGMTVSAAIPASVIIRRRLSS